MKTLFSIISLLLLAISANAADPVVYQFNRFTTNLDQTQIDGGTLTNISFVAPTITQTNFVSGLPYTNFGTHTLQIFPSVVMNANNVSGAAEMSIYVDPAGGTAWGRTNRITTGTTATIPSDQFVYQFTAFVPPGASYVITNTSRGTGNTATIDIGTSFLIRY